ncbi:hypothetical protein AVEN_39752-1 [Araneus ventricosus]|uniref:Uncharacterized protein n=1 Tax=Araneus ventricosus TaxID=182803 RepID=A0A4Y2LL66_ARAVE|nr:hypothetical protein AVEN_39752-1 [Araneus ventricosus]
MATLQQKASLASLWFHESKSIVTVQRYFCQECRNCRSPSGYTIPKGTGCAVFIYFLHRDKAVFPDPDAFIPERFLPVYRRAQLLSQPGKGNVLITSLLKWKYRSSCLPFEEISPSNLWTKEARYDRCPEALSNRPLPFASGSDPHRMKGVMNFR